MVDIGSGRAQVLDVVTGGGFGVVLRKGSLGEGPRASSAGRVRRDLVIASTERSIVEGASAQRSAGAE